MVELDVSPLNREKKGLTISTILCFHIDKRINNNISELVF